MHFTDGALRNCFAVVELSFGPGPIIVAGPVDQEHLKGALLNPPRNGTGRNNGHPFTGVVRLIRHGGIAFQQVPLPPGRCTLA
ncbi:hypothetical protein StoSoilA2_32410 [Arthrobacter sp. StoSoilA2]|nr:hypothetical protein StoSoilA2_32410 [Arthrobacter sp. StoSoilA2]